MSQKLANLQAALERILGDKIKRLDSIKGELTLTVSPADYHDICLTLRDHAELKFEMLVDLCGMDYSTYKDGGPSIYADGPRFCAITHLLSGVVDGVDRADDDDEPEIFSLIGLLWAGTAFLWMVNFWWFQYRLLAMEGPWTVWRYLFMVLYSVVLYVLAVVLVPRDWDKVKRYDEFFMRNRRWFFIALLLASAADLLDSWFKGGMRYVVDMGPINNLVVLVTVPVVVIGIASRRLATQKIIAWLYFALYLLSVFEYTPVLDG